MKSSYCWNTRGDFAPLQNVIDQMLGHLNVESPFTSRPYVDVNLGEDDENLFVEIIAPGTDPESIEVSFADRELTVKGKKVPPTEGDIHWIRSERPSGEFHRRVAIRTDIDADKIEADFRNGVLLVTLPKAEEAKARKIKIRKS